MPPRFIINRVLSNALIALTQNFRTNFLEVVQGRLEPVPELKSFCDQIDINFASTAFCIESAKILDQIKCHFIKIASFQHAHSDLLENIIKAHSTEQIFISKLSYRLNASSAGKNMEWERITNA